MKKVFKIPAILLAASLAAAGSVAFAQVVPAANAGPASFGYSFNYSESAEFGEKLGEWQTAVASGRLNYRTGMERLPFSVMYAGGYTWTIGGADYSNGYYQHLLASQGFVGRRWRAFLSDNISYLPQAPITSFAGVPGSGEPVGTPNPAPPTDQTVLTIKTRVIDNAVGLVFLDRLSLGTSLTGSGGWGLLRYPDNNGINVNTYSGTVGLLQRLNARMSIDGSYAWSEFTYPSYDLAFQTQTVFLGFTRIWNRKFTTGVDGGPQWVTSSDSTSIPSSTNFAINTFVRYHLKNVSASVTYARGVSGGAGYLLGGHSDVVSGNLSRTLGRSSMSIGLEGSYQRLKELENNEAISSEDVGVGLTRKLGRHFQANVNYMVINQAYGATLPSNVLSDIVQSFTFGFGYSPRQSRIIR
jgi:hypothetical protein